MNKKDIKELLDFAEYVESLIDMIEKRIKEADSDKIVEYYKKLKVYLQETYRDFYKGGMQYV